jgi:hypothetical protein
MFLQASSRVLKMSGRAEETANTLIDVLDEPDSRILREADFEREDGNVRKKQKMQNSSTASKYDAKEWRRLQEYHIENPPKKPAYDEMPAGHRLYKCLRLKQPVKGTKRPTKKLAIVTKLLES